MTDVYRISARGNGYTSFDRVQDFVLLKAAETTLAAGASYFTVVNEADRTSVISGQTPGTMQTSVYGRTALTTYNPGATYNIVKPGESVLSVGGGFTAVLALKMSGAKNRKQHS